MNDFREVYGGSIDLWYNGPRNLWTLFRAHVRGNKTQRKVVEMRRIELLTFWLRTRRSPNWATPPFTKKGCLYLINLPCTDINYFTLLKFTYRSRADSMGINLLLIKGKMGELSLANVALSEQRYGPEVLILNSWGDFERFLRCFLLFLCIF